MRFEDMRFSWGFKQREMDQRNVTGTNNSREQSIDGGAAPSMILYILTFMS